MFPVEKDLNYTWGVFVVSRDINGNKLSKKTFGSRMIGK